MRSASRLILRLFRLAALLYAAMTTALLGWTFLWTEPNLDAQHTAEAIVCLGGGMAPDGTLATPVLTRIERCVALYDAGLAPVIVFSGGTARPQGPDAGSQMATYARTLGLPPEHALVEPRAQSTLQNALFSLELLPDARRLILVTEAFHLPRAFASFRWAAMEVGRGPLDISLVMSEPVRRDRNGWPSLRMLARESLAIWFNLARATAYSLAPDPQVDWLH